MRNIMSEKNQEKWLRFISKQYLLKIYIHNIYYYKFDYYLSS